VPLQTAPAGFPESAQGGVSDAAGSADLCPSGSWWGSESDLALRISCDSPHKNELAVTAKKAAVFCTTHKPMAVREQRRVSIDLERPSARFPSFGSFARLKQSCASASQRVRTSRKLDCWAMPRNAAYKRSYSSECIIALSRSGHENIDGPACGEQVGAIVASGRPLPARSCNTATAVELTLFNIAHLRLGFSPF
jgi:hypothetical protein